MTTDFRALCAELLAALEIQLDELRFNDRLCIRARAALNQAESQKQCVYSPVQIAECGGPCEQGPEYCDCGELCATHVTTSKPEPETAATTRAMSNPIPVSSPVYVVVVEDSGDGKPMAFEAELQHSDTIEKAQAHQNSIGDRYGRTWIAECHILPDTERKPAPVTPFEAGAARASLQDSGPFLRYTALHTLRRFIREQEQADG